MAMTRRQMLLGSTAIGGLAVAAVAVASPLTCAEMHAELIAQYRQAARAAGLAANNLVSLAMDLACPCCGEPLFRLLG